MLSIGVDLSFTSCGIVVCTDDVVVHFERFVTDTKQTKFESAFAVAKKVGSVLAQFKPDKFGIEGLGFGGFGNATRDLAGLQYAILIEIVHSTPVIKMEQIGVVTPKTLKLFATKNGKADKSSMIAALPPKVKEQFETAGFKKTTGLGDLADAYWLSQYVQT